MKAAPPGMSLQAAIVVVVLAVLAGGAYFVFYHPNAVGDEQYPELSVIASDTTGSFDKLAAYFRELAQKKTAAYAFQVLLRAQIPPGIDMHLLAHVVGDVLYKQQGLEGIKICTDDFRNACSHSVVIGVLNDRGEGALPEIAATCKRAPGGSGAYTMCFHGLGHGVLAFNAYNFEKAISMCKKTGTPEYQDREYIECVGGATMEMIAGVHDQTSWEKEVGNYFKSNDPLYPCDASFMPSEVRPICLTYLTPHLFTAAGADLGSPDPVTFPRAFSYCNPLTEKLERISCYGGFGKEFVVLAESRDVRDIGSMDESSLRVVRSWCALAPNAESVSYCNSAALSSLFWGGENNPNASFAFCAIAEGGAQSECYANLAENIRNYLGTEIRGRELCQRLPATFQPACLGKTL